MPTLRLVYLTEQQYAVMTDHAHAGAANNTTAEEQLPSINQEQTRLPIADATRNASLHKPPAGKEMKVEEQSYHEDEDNDYLDTILQESIDAANRRSFGGHAIHHHQQIQQEIMVLSSDEESENDSSSSERRMVDAVQQFQHEMVSSDEESENDSTPSAQVQVDAVQQKSGNERKIPAPNQSFDKHFNDLMAFKAKYGHCDVSRTRTGDNAKLGRWCGEMRSSYKKIQNDEMPNMNLSDEQIQRLNDAEFKWSLRGNFDNRFNDLMAFKAKYGHCDVPLTGENASLGRWCIELRVSNKKVQNNEMPNMKISDEQIQRLNDAGFRWCLKKREFDERFNDLMAFKAKYGHCDVPRTGENVSLGLWCNLLRVSYKKIQNNQTPNMNLSDANIQRLNDAGFKLSVKGKFDNRFNDLMAFKAKYGHCDVSRTRTGDNATLGRWCSELRSSYKKIQNNQMPKNKLSDEQIQRLNDAGFKWCRYKTF